MTDTDPLTHEMETEDVYADFWRDKDKFDDSDYPGRSPFFEKAYKKVIVKLEDETKGVPLRNS